MPSATVTPIVWLPGRVRAWSPWRQARERGRGSHPASRRVAHAARTRSRERARRPRRGRCRRPAAGPPARARARPARRPRRPRSPRAGAAARVPASTGCRSRIAGGTARAERSGQSAKRSVARHPARSPVATAPGATRASSSKGTNGWSSGPSASWTAVPRTAPARLPSAPSASAWTRYTAVSVRALAPRQRRMAIVADLPREERAHGGRHADAADEQARDAHQAQVGGELVEEAAEPGLRLVERGDAHGGVGHRLPQRGARRARLEPGGEPHEGAVPHAAAEPDEARCLEARGVQEHARPEREERRRAIGLLPDDAGHGEASRRRWRACRRSRGRAARGRLPRPRRLRRPAARRAAARARCRAARRGDSRRRPPSARRGACRPARGSAPSPPARAPGSRRRRGARGRGPAPPPRDRAGGAERSSTSPPSRARASRPSERSSEAATLRTATRAPTPSAMHARKPAKCRQAPRVSRQARPATRRQGSAGGAGAAAERRRPHAAARSPTTRPSRSSTIRSA